MVRTNDTASEPMRDGDFGAPRFVFGLVLRHLESNCDGELAKEGEARGAGWARAHGETDKAH